MKKAIAIFVVCCVIAAFADNPHVTHLVELIDVALSSPADGDVLAFDAATNKWINKPATSDGSKVILRYQQENISGSITPTTIFIPNETAMYRGSVVVVSPVSSTCIGTDEQIGVNISATDGSFLAGGIGRLGDGANVTAGEVLAFRGIAGSPWTLNTVGQFLSIDNCPYSFYIVVEKL